MICRLVILFLALHTCIWTAQSAEFLDSDSPSIQVAENVMVKVRRVGEGHHELIAILGKKQFVLWKSYWGRFEVLYNQEKKLLVVQDLVRFGGLSPVAAFRYSEATVEPIYQTPGNWALEETRFSYNINGLEGNQLRIEMIVMIFQMKGSHGQRKKENLFSPLNLTSEDQLSQPSILKMTLFFLKNVFRQNENMGVRLMSGMRVSTFY